MLEASPASLSSRSGACSVPLSMSCSRPAVVPWAKAAMASTTAMASRPRPQPQQVGGAVDAGGEQRLVALDPFGRLGFVRPLRRAGLLRRAHRVHVARRVRSVHRGSVRLPGSSGSGVMGRRADPWWPSADELSWLLRLEARVRDVRDCWAGCSSRSRAAPSAASLSPWAERAPCRCRLAVSS